MQHHALALAGAGADVTLVGLAGTPPLPAVSAHPRIARRLLPAGGAGRGRAGRGAIVLGSWQVAAQAVRLFRALAFSSPAPDVVLVQTPPAVPTLAVAWAAARLRGARLVIDWHNLGHTLLGLRFGPRHPAVRVYGWLERAGGRLGDGHLAVSAALARWLEAKWGLARVAVAYDRAPADAAPLPDDERARVRQALAGRAGLPASPAPAIVIGPTSWTADEDFDLLLDAIDRLEARARTAGAFPPLLVLLTGLGPRRAAVEARLAARPAGRVVPRTAWLDGHEYPRALAAADLGLCFHRSSSGLDLPMKLADMRAAGLPACALAYTPALAERFAEGEHGWLFTDAASLADRLFALFAGFPARAAALDGARAALAARPDRDWQAAWDSEARPAILGETGR